MIAIIISKSEFRKLIHSVKHLEYFWGVYKTKFPNHAWDFNYRVEVESFIYRDKYSVLRQVRKVPLTKRVYLSKKQYQSLRKYASICRSLRRSLRRKKPIKKSRS